MAKYKLNNCIVCGSKTSVDFEEHEIYCTGCSLSVQNTEKDLNQLVDEWNNAFENICKRLAKTKDMPPEFIMLVDNEFWNLI